MGDIIRTVETVETVTVNYQEAGTARPIWQDDSTVTAGAQVALWRATVTRTVHANGDVSVVREVLVTHAYGLDEIPWDALPERVREQIEEDEEA